MTQSTKASITSPPHEIAASAPPAVLYDLDARGVVTLTLNRPEAFNALSEEVLSSLQSVIDRVAQEPTARVVVLAGAGRAFCPGHHLKEMVDHPQLAYYQSLFNRCAKVMLGLQKLPLPVIAKVHGVATAAGCQLVAQCDLAVTSDKAKFATSGIQFGLFCSTPSVPLSRNLPTKQAFEMLVTGDFISAAEALARGLVNRVVPADQLDEAVAQLVQSVLDKPASAVAIGKALFYQQREVGIEAAYQLAAQAMAVNMMDDAAQEGFLAFTEKREPAWRRA